MIGNNKWSYSPYRPLMTDSKIYINRIVPSLNEIHFEWLGDPNCTYSVYLRERDKVNFAKIADVIGNEFDFVNLKAETDYAFYISDGSKKSCVRLARTGFCEGSIVNYLHPEDSAYSFSGKYLCSPSLVRHPDGFLLASMDVFAPGFPQNLTLIFRSDDNGKTWHYVSELMPCFWGKMFIHKGELYMLGCSTEYGDLMIGKSLDGGKTFTAPTVILRGSNGKHGNSGFHTNPQNMVVFNDRIYRAVEWGAWANTDYCHIPLVISCNINDDLLVAENWSITTPKRYDPSVEGFGYVDKPVTIEGTVVPSIDGKLYNILRYNRKGYAAVYEIDTTNPEAALTQSFCMPFDAHRSKFMIKYDDVGKRYYSIGDCSYDNSRWDARNYLCLLSSSDLKQWRKDKVILDYRDYDSERIGFQYIDFIIEGDDIIFLSRTAMNQADSYHNTNYSTFHVIENFRKYSGNL